MMMNLYILDKPFGENGWKLALKEKTAAIVLIQDGTYMDCAPLHAAGLKIYALRQDVEMRGMAQRLPDFIVRIDFGQLVDLIVENRVINFA